MPGLYDYTSYADAKTHFSNEALWGLFDGSRDNLNIAHECIDRHAETPAELRCVSRMTMAATSSLRLMLFHVGHHASRMSWSLAVCSAANAWL